MSASVTRRVSGAREDFMAIIVIALGVIMVLGGAYEIYFGNTYISVERGWSAFISGTVLLTGGLVTIALGLAIRAVTDLKSALVERATSFPAVSHGRHGHVEPAFAQDEFTPPDFVEPPRQEALVASPAAAGSAALAEALTPEPAPDLPPVGGRVAHVADRVEAHPSALDADLHETHARRSDGHDVDVMAPALAADAERLEPVHAESDHRDRTGHSGEDTPPAVDDWLDRSFADLGREFDTPSATPPVHDHRQEEARHQDATHDDPRHVAPSHALPSDARVDDAEYVEHVDEHHSEHVHEPTATEVVEPSHDEPLHADADKDSAPAAPTAAVIGRYEAEGTSYVMYADGSIEAQSEAGVYRFASMAELKSFIEG